MNRKHQSADSNNHAMNVHGLFKPSSVRRGEHIRCFILGGGLKNENRFEVYRLSPFGLEVLQREDVKLSQGDQIQVALEVTGQRTTCNAVVIATDIAEGSKKLLGIRLETTPKGALKGIDMDHRGGNRWQCHKLFAPTGVAQNRARFADRILFRVADISAQGLKLITSMRNKHLGVGLEFNLELQLPSVGTTSVRVRIVYIDVRKEHDGLNQILGTKLLNPSYKTLSLMGQYILQFGGDDKLIPSPRLLTSEGFPIHSVAGAMEYDVVRSDEDYQQVLRLRNLAFGGVEGFSAKSTPEKMSDIYDARSRIVICRYRGNVVATLRLCFHEEGDQFEEEQYVKFPADFPPRELVVEASRAATDPDFRSSDLFMNLIRYSLLMTMQSGRRWTVQSTYKKLVPVYERIGFVQTGIRCPHPFFPNESLYLLLADCQRLLDGRVANPLLWNALMPDIHHLLENNENIRLSWFAKKRISLFQALTPLYRMYEKRMMERRIRTKVK